MSSLAVIEELENGNHPNKIAALKLVENIPLLPVNEYVNQQIMPSDPRGDALHLALAAYHRCHFLLTWNCRHLANANKFEHIRYVNSNMGLFNPILTTPVELLEQSEE